jgi:hypothetical protein
MKPRLRYIVTALDNVALIETMTSGQLVTEPSPAARSYFAAKRDALFANPTQNAPFFENAWLPWREAFSATRKWEGYSDRLAVRHRDLYANSLLLDAHGVPGTIQNNPNDPQNELRLRRFRPLYSQATVYQNRDEFTPITVDTNQIARLLQSGSPDSTAAFDFIANQVTQAENRDMAGEFQTLMQAIGEKAAQLGIFHVQLPDLGPGATTDDARDWASTVRTIVRELADFVPWFSPAKAIQTVPIEQVRLVIRLSTMQRVGALGYGTSFNPEFVFALPADQIVELPDHYFDRNPGLADKQMFLVDAGNDQVYGSIILDDTFFDWGVDPYVIKSSENRAIHHSSILDVNPFKTFITGGVGAGTEIVTLQIVPDTITASLYGPDGVIADAGDVVRGQRYSTTAAVLDADGFPAGGWTVAVTGSDSATGRTVADQYGNVQIAMDDVATTITVTWTSILDDSVTEVQTFDLTGPAANYDGSGIIVVGSTTLVFAAGSGSGGTLTYSTIPTGVVLTQSADGITYTAITPSPIAVGTGDDLYIKETASAGYVFSDGEAARIHGPYTAA